MFARLFSICTLVLTLGGGIILLPPPLAVGIGIMALLFWFMVNRYPDKLLLHYFQARETIERDHPRAHRMAQLQTQKLGMPIPKIYTYSGFFQRAFALGGEDRLIFLVELKTLEKASEQELAAMFFMLSLQASERLTSRHTMSLVLYVLVWTVPLKVVGKSLWQSWLLQFLVAPLATLIYERCMPPSVWKKFLKRLGQYPLESAQINEFNARLEQPMLAGSDVRTLSYRYHVSYQSPAQQMILALEGTSHPFDFMKTTDFVRASHA